MTTDQSKTYEETDEERTTRYVETGMFIIDKRVKYLESKYKGIDLDDVRSELCLILLRDIIPRYVSTETNAFYPHCWSMIVWRSIDAMRSQRKNYRAKRFVELVDDIEYVNSYSSFTKRVPSVEQEVIAKLDCEAVSGKLSDLTSSQLACVQLSAAGMTLKDIGMLLDITESGAHHSRKQGRNKLVSAVDGNM